MCRNLLTLIIRLTVVAVASILAVRGQASAPDDAILAALMSHEYNLHDDGRKFLLDEAGKNDFFLLGELHGDNEIPALLKALWPGMWEEGYRNVAAEVSPWAA